MACSQRLSLQKFYTFTMVFAIRIFIALQNEPQVLGLAGTLLPVAVKEIFYTKHR